MFIHKLTFLLVLLLFNQIIYAGQREIHLTYEKCLENIILENSELRNALLEKSIAQEEKREILGDFDPTLSLSILNRDSEQPSSNLIDGSHAKRFDYNLSLSKKFITGTRFSLDFDNYRYWTDSTYETLNPSYKSSLGIGFSQSLFENIFGLRDRLEIKSSQKTIEINALKHLHELNQVVHDASVKYFELLLLHKKKKILYAHLHLNEKLLKMNRERFKTGLATNEEVIETRSYIVDNYNEITKTNDLINGIEKELFTMMNLSMTLNEKARIIPDDMLTVPDDIPEVPVDEYFLYIERSDIQAKETELKQIELEIKQYHNEQLPDLDLTGSIAKNGIGATYPDDLEYLKDENRISWKIGLDFTLPLGIRAGKGRLNQKLYKREQIINELEALKKQTLIEYHSLIRSLRFVKEQLKLSEKQIELTRRTMKYEKHLFKIGKATNLDLLNIQKKYHAAQMEKLDIIWKYNVIIFDYYRNKGTIAVRYLYD